MRSLRLGLAGLLVGVGLVVGPSGGAAPAAESPRVHLALGDSVATGYGASEGYVQRFFAFLQARGSVDSLRNLARDGETSGSFLSDQLPRAFEVIADPATDVTVVTLDIGGNDGLRNGSCIFPNAGDSCRATLGRFAINYGNALVRLSEALASDPGLERLLVMTYYNPWSGTGREMEPVVDHTLLGDDGKLDCSASGADLGGNDLIACIGARHGAEVADVYPGFKGRGLELIADGIHPNDAGHALIAEEFARVWIAGLAESVPPVLTLPAPIRVEATGPAGATVTYAVSAVDNSDPGPLVSCQPPSGSTFPVGTTTVRCTARDASGNTSVGSFDVLVRRPPGPLRCGDTITEDTRLRRDLRNCRSDGLVIGADNITLDLNGHTIDGDGNNEFLGEAGVQNGDPDRGAAGHDGVRVSNGVIRQFGIGVVLQDASANSLRRLSTSEAGFGVALFGDSAANRIEGNSASRNEGDGIHVEGANNRVRQNVVFNNRGHGVLLSGFGDGNVIENNTARNNGFAGIELSDSFGRSLIRNNLVIHNGVFGISLVESRNALIEKNRVFSSGADGIEILDLGPNVIRSNLSSQNADDGIDVRFADGNTVVRNSANSNGDLGIEAVPGVIDGGGNRASGNGNPLQCLNVFCR